MKSSFVFIAILLTPLFFQGCASTSSETGSRSGLFDRLSSLEGGSRPRRFQKGEKLSEAQLSAIQNQTQNWRWPLRRVAITSPFGDRDRDFHEGVDLKAGTGTSVYAAQSGRVIYAGSKIRGYGRMVVIEHQSGLFSVYAHHSKNFVRRGQWVKRGQQIALSGKTGRVSGPHLHFEIRKGVVPVDPAQIMSRRSVAATR